MPQGHTPGSSLSINMLRGGPELLVATLGSTGDSPEKGDNGGEQGQGRRGTESWWQPLETWIQLSLQPAWLFSVGLLPRTNCIIYKPQQNANAGPFFKND